MGEGSVFQHPSHKSEAHDPPVSAAPPAWVQQHGSSHLGSRLGRAWEARAGRGRASGLGEPALIGLRTPAEFVKRLRYCEYLGKYFCDCCHSYSESCIPARILRMWDFRKYYVSDFSKRLLDLIWHEPIFNLLRVGHGLYAKAKELDRVRVSRPSRAGVQRPRGPCGRKWTSPPGSGAPESLSGWLTVQQLRLMLQRPPA